MLRPRRDPGDGTLCDESNTNNVHTKGQQCQAQCYDRGGRTRFGCMICPACVLYTLSKHASTLWFAPCAFYIRFPITFQLYDLPLVRFIYVFLWFLYTKQANHKVGNSRKEALRSFFKEFPTLWFACFLCRNYRKTYIKRTRGKS